MPLEPPKPDLPPSKSQLKREQTALQKLGERLVDLTDGQLARLDLPEAVVQAVREARAIRAHGARRRQLQYIGRVLRETDVDADALAQGLAGLDAPHRAQVARQRTAETLRARLLEAGDDALPEVLERFPDADRQHLRRLVRAARSERDRGAPPKSARALFRYLHGLAAPEE